MKPEPSGSRKFGDIAVHWHCHPAEPACEVKMWWRGNLFVDKVLRRQPPEQVTILKFNLRPEGAVRTVTSGQFELLFDGGGMRELVLELRYMDEEMQRHLLWPRGPEPIPPEPVPPEPVPEPLAVDSEAGPARIDYGAETDLFPYLYLRPWPGATPRQKADRFIAYEGGAVPLPPSSFYTYLAQRAKAQDRAGMEAAAANFIEIGPAHAETGFVADLAQLPEPLRHFAACDTLLRAQPELGWHAFRYEVERQLHRSWPALRREVNSPGFAAAVGRCWDSVLALTIMLGDQRHLLDLLIKTIVLANLLARMLPPLAEGEAEDEAAPLAPAAPAQDTPPELAATEAPAEPLPLPLPVPPAWPAARIADGVRATLVLPAALFPLPAAPGNASAPAEPVILPYAIGDLELVRQRLAGYALGEVSRIDNVMRGESLETTRRQLDRSSHTDTERGAYLVSANSVESGAHSDYLQQAHRSLAAAFELDKNTSYGPPTDAVAKEKISMAANPDQTPQLQHVEAAARRAREITSRTASQLTRRAEWERSSSSLQEHEETVVHRIDGSHNERNLRGVHRWVDKIYQAYVVNYGHRLILEFHLEQPAAAYLAEQQSLHGRCLRKPPAPAEFGVQLYTDIALDPASPAYYAQLIAAYQTYDVSLPPAASKIVSVSANASVSGSSQQIAIPDGYQARSATVSATWHGGAAAAAVFGMVGSSAYALPAAASGPAAAGAPPASVTLALNGESGTLPLSIALVPPASAADAAAAPIPPAVCVAGFDITLEPTAAAIERWQFQLYHAIQAAYQRQLQAWQAATGATAAGASPQNPLASQQTVRQALCRQMRQALWQCARDKIGAAGLPDINQGRYRQFFDQAFEWNEMTYAFSSELGAGPAELAAGDNLLTAFLQAASARVLLPVRPAQMERAPYFLDSGMLWQGDSSLVPTVQASIDLVNELKQCGGAAAQSDARSQCWEFRIPTAMTVIQAGEELPTFR